MVHSRRVVIATGMGVITAMFCIGSLLANPPPGVTPELWFVSVIFVARVMQGLAIGAGDAISLHPAARGAVLGAVFSAFIAIVPFVHGNNVGGWVLVIFGILYGILTDLVATRFSRGV